MATLLTALRASVLIASAAVLSGQAAAASTDDPLPRFECIDHVTINVSDLAKSEAWYTAMLGFRRVQEHPRYVILMRANIRIVLNRATTFAATADAATRPGIYHLAFKVAASAFLPAVEVLRSRGTPTDVGSDGDHQNGYFQDPDGNWLELTASAPDSSADPEAAVTWLADVLLDHLEAVDLNARRQRHLPVDRLPDLSAEGALAEAEFNRRMLERLNVIRNESLPHEQQILAAVLRQMFQSGAAAKENYWFEFKVTPYSGGFIFQSINQELGRAPIASESDRENFMKLMNAYQSLLTTIRAKTLAQAQMGIRVPRDALPGVLATLRGARESSIKAIGALEGRSRADDKTGIGTFLERMSERLDHGVVPSYDALIGVFDKSYIQKAPIAVGVSQYAGGREYYRRRIYAETGLDLTPEEIHERGLRTVAELEPKLRKIRSDIGFKGDDKSFQHYLQTNARFLATSPEEVEAKYRSYLDRIANKLPQFFAVLPTTPFDFQRLDPGAEAGMTYGYYAAPTPSEPRGIYYYNGSNLSQRTLATSAHLIYHETLPGHHLRYSLAEERNSQHPVFQIVSFGAFEEGWAEYAADLAAEMGAMQDPYDLYGHLMLQSFLACRLVVDTGMNYLSWSRARAEKYLRDHSMESDIQIDTETLRYSTDMPAQALDYRLGYEAIMNGRRRAEEALGNRFDIRAFNTGVSNNGAMPLDVLSQQVDWFIRQSLDQ